MIIDVLGTEYEIIRRDYEDEAAFLNGAAGYCDFAGKRIILGNLCTFPVHKDSLLSERFYYEKAGLRHEIVHAFLYESGLDADSFARDGGWARNEEMIGWFSLQGPKIYKVWNELEIMN